jgi:hypothetical protein
MSTWAWEKQHSGMGIGRGEGEIQGWTFDFLQEPQAGRRWSAPPGMPYEESGHGDVQEEEAVILLQGQLRGFVNAGRSGSWN